MEGYCFDSDVMPVPDVAVPYVCAVQRDVAEKLQTVFWLRVLTQREANEIAQHVANLRKDAGIGGLDMSAIHTRQFQLLRDRVEKIENYPDGKGGRKTITTAEEKLKTFERMPTEVFGEISAAVQSWSAAREGILGNVGSACNGDSQTKS